jgi:hypothetical protein
MREKRITGNEAKRIFYAGLEEFARDLLEQEVTEWLGREKSEHKLSPLEQSGISQRVR